MGTINDKLTSIGDAIRSKTGGTEKLSLDEMATEIHKLDVGGTRNFSIVGSPTKPANPLENTIWIRTYADICGWSMDTVRPELPEEGFLWIRTDNEFGVKINLYNDCDMPTYIICSEQYIFGEWCQVITRIYQGGEWIDPLRGVIYHRGIVNEEVTGGIEEYYNYYSSNTPGSVIYEDGGDHFKLYRPKDQSSYGLTSCGTVKAVDLSGFSKLTISYHANNSATFSVSQVKPVNDSVSNTTSAYILNGYDTNNISSPIRTAVIDISTINDPRYVFVKFNVANSGISSSYPAFVTVYDIHME